MYYLIKFCRICIKTGVQLTDIDTIDYDSVKLSEKLDIFMKMVVNNNNNNNKENLSRQICLQCVEKLRISYDFQKLCQQSTRILQSYLCELISNKRLSPENFINSELRVTLTPLHINHNIETNINRNKKKRITKEQRCSLLQKLLTSTKQRNSGGIIQKKKKPKSKKKQQINGGLKNIIEFTKNYNFGYKIDNKYNKDIIDSPLGKLVNFTKNFFINNFTDFQNRIVYLIENRDNLSDSDIDDDDIDEIMFNTIPQEEHDIIRFEEVIVEPDIKIKNELIDYEDNSYNNNITPNYYVETSYDDDDNIEYKNDNKYSPARIFIKETNNVLIQQQANSVQLLDKLVDNFDNHNKVFSRFNARCRTRDNPYINPQLRQQFQLRSFQCKLCNRLFKSPGYLKAHTSKVHP